jgi:hypothetical protein
MKPLLSLFASPTTALVLSVSLLAACGERGDPSAAGSAGSSAGGTTPAAGGPGGPGSVGGSAPGSSGVGAGAGSEAAGSAGAAGGSAIPATFETVKLVFGGGGGIMTCAAAPCHGVGGVAPPSKPLELPPNDDRQLYANLTTYVSTACNDTKLVTPGQPAQSALITILSGPCGMTPRMPYGCSTEAGDCIPDEYIAAVVQWIASGAPPP